MALMEHIWSDVVAPTTFHGGLSKRVHAFLFSSREVRWRRQPGAPGNGVEVGKRRCRAQAAMLLGFGAPGYKTFGLLDARVRDFWVF